MQGNQVNAGQPQSSSSMGDNRDDRRDTNYRRDDDRGDRAPRDEAPVGGSNVRGMFSYATPALRRNTGSRTVLELVDNLNKCYETNKATLPGYDVRVIPAPRDSLSKGVNYSNQIGLVIVVFGLEGYYAYHSLLIQSELGKPRQNPNDRYETVQAPRTPSTVADDELADLIDIKVRAMLPDAKSIYSADWSSIPFDFNLSDESSIFDLFVNAYAACFTELMTKAPDYQPPRLTGAKGDNTNQAVVYYNQDMAVNGTDVVDAYGMPVRHDIVIEMGSTNPNEGRRNRNTTDNVAGEKPFGQLSLFTNLVIDPAAGRGNYRRDDRDSQEYSGQVVITNVSLYEGADIGPLMLLLSSALTQLDSGSRPFLRPFMPLHLQSGARKNIKENMRDLGAMNYDYEARDADGKILPWNTHNERDFDQREFYDLTDRIIHPSATLAIDIPECGTTTWMLRALADADKNSDARNYIIRIMDALTGKTFGDHLGSARFFSSNYETVLLGHYHDGDKLRDLRNVDLPFLMNAKGHEDPKIGRQWMGTFAGNDERALAERADIIAEVVSGAVFTGVATRRVFTADFLNALERSLEDIDLHVDAVISGDDSRMSNYRYSASWHNSDAAMTNFKTRVYSSNRSSSGGRDYRGMSGSSRRSY